MRKMNCPKKIIGLMTIRYVSSSDKVVRESEIVENELTGERIENAEVSLNAGQGNRPQLTNSNGYCNNIKAFSCGIGNCDTDFTLTFEKEGFQSENIDENYYYNPSTEFVTEGTKDTLIVKMQPN